LNWNSTLQIHLHVMAAYGLDLGAGSDPAMDTALEDMLIDVDQVFGSSRSRKRRKRMAQYMRSLGGSRRATKTKKRVFPRLDWEKQMAFLTSREFTRFYKLDKRNFPNVLKRLVGHMEKARPRGEHVNGVRYELELACTLRWLAGGNYMDIHHMHGISEAAFWCGLHATIYALLAEYGASELGDSKFKDPDKLSEMEKTFRQHNEGLLKGCVGAIDGMAVKICRPTDSECANPMSYYSRKGFFAVVLQAICDGNCRFTWGSIKCAGSTHDSTCWCITELFRFALCAMLCVVVSCPWHLKLV
jgi:hypothetical protein